MSVVNDVSMAVLDWQPMRTRLRDIIEEFKSSKCPISTEQKKQTENFLVWLNDHNFTLMGYRSYGAKGIKGDYRWVADNDSSLGLMKNSKTDRDRVLSNIPASAREEALSHNPLMLTKTNSRSRVHRPAYLDYVGIKRFDDEGKVIGEDRFIECKSVEFLGYLHVKMCSGGLFHVWYLYLESVTTPSCEKILRLFSNNHLPANKKLNLRLIFQSLYMLERITLPE